MKLNEKEKILNKLRKLNSKINTLDEQKKPLWDRLKEIRKTEEKQ